MASWKRIAKRTAGTLEGIEDDQKLDQGVIYRRASWLNNLHAW
jgi:hypothetical protein